MQPTCRRLDLTLRLCKNSSLRHASLAMLLFVACTHSARDPSTRAAATCDLTSGAHHAGDRNGIHGMVLFGRSTYFLDHIPMFSPPHDEQLVMRVSIKTAEGAPVTNDFSDQGYSVQPTTQFPLDDLVLGKRVTFTANIHRGNFEHDGPVLLANVTIAIDAVLVARKLPGTDAIAADEQEYFVVGTADDAYAVNFIRDTRGFQQIVRIDAIDGATLSPSRVLRVKAKSPHRLAASTAAKSCAGEPISLAIGKELWCLKAPDFVAPCD